MVAKHGVKPGQVMLIHGQVIRPDQVQQISPYEAMKMITLWAAEQFGEQATKGSTAGRWLLGQLQERCGRPLSALPQLNSKARRPQRGRSLRMRW